MTDHRQAAVDRLSALLERDELSVDDYRTLVERVLATTSDNEIALVLADAVPPTTTPAVPEDVVVISNERGVVKQAPHRLATCTEVKNDTGVVKLDFGRAHIEGDEVDVDIENDSGVIKVTLPYDASVQVVEHHGGGVFKNRTRPSSDPDAPRILLHVRNGSGVVKVTQRRWRRR